ncbi:hypothetical protein A3SO_04131, partial [Pseudomonas syringae pv. actinidiae ICMP 19072]
HVMASSLFIWLGWVMFSGSPSSLVCVILALGGHLAYFTGLLIRQKTIYNIHYPDFASSFFKGIAIAVILIFVFIAVLTGSLLFLIGPVAMAFIAALKLLNWTRFRGPIQA